jgi:hypothetical protein
MSRSSGSGVLSSDGGTNSTTHHEDGGLDAMAIATADSAKFEDDLVRSWLLVFAVAQA